MLFGNVKVKIGLESHIQLNTKSKLFCSCSTSAAAEANENTCQTCVGFPGAKPTLNAEVVKKSVMLATLMGCKINDYSKFARKIYFYPDLAKSFQITQYAQPIAIHGQFVIEVGGNKKVINITRAHIEEDPGKVEYVGGHIGTATQTLIDYNRSGTPLCEVVTEPDFASVEEAITYVKKLFHLLSYLDIIDPSKEGVMRTDANVSIDGGERVELKNISGSDAIEKALKAEIARQSMLKSRGQKIGRETRMYSEETGTTILLRKKEYEEEYGYIDEPDLFPIPITKEFIEQAKKEMKKLPEEVYEEIMQKYKLPRQIAHQLAYKRGLYDYFKNCLKELKDSDMLARWLVGDFLKCANWHNFEIESCPDEGKFIKFMKLIEGGKMQEREAKELIKKMFDSPKSGIGELETGEKVDLGKVIGEVLLEQKDTVAKIKGGDEKGINFLLGQVLRKAGFKGDPKAIMEEIRKKIAQ